MRVEVRAIDLAKHYFTEQGYMVEDVSRKRGHNGYDFLISRKNVLSKVEVKGCSREWQIPDLFSTEFDQDKWLIADILCVVYLIKSQKPSICIIPRNAIPPSDVTPKISYRISSRFKKRTSSKNTGGRLSLRTNQTTTLSRVKQQENAAPLDVPNRSQQLFR